MSPKPLHLLPLCPWRLPPSCSTPSSSTSNLGPCDFSLRPLLPGHLDEEDDFPSVLMAGGPQD